MEISQLTPVIDMNGDSISNYVFEIRKLLIQRGFQSNVYVEERAAFFPYFIKNYKDFNPKEGDIVILHATIATELTGFYKNLKCKKLLIYHNHTPAIFFKNINDKIYGLLNNYENDLKSLIEYTDLVVCDSDFNKKCLEKIGFTNIKVCPIFLDSIRLEEINQSIYTKFNDDYVNIIHVGRIIPNKKIEDIIKVFYFYNTFINSKSRLVLIGLISGEISKYHASLTKYIDKLNLKNVYFTNQIKDKDLAAYYKTAGIFLYMSEHEGMGLPLIEAMNFEIPIIAFNSTAIPGTLGNSGILVNKKDFRKIAELIDILMTNNDLKNKIVKGQKERLKYFEAERLKGQFMGYILNLKNSDSLIEDSKNNVAKEEPMLNKLKSLKDIFKKDDADNKSYTYLFNHPEAITEIKILYIQPKGVGDIIMSTPIIRALKKKYPFALIDFAADDYCKDVIAGNPNINGIHSFNNLPNLQEYVVVLRPYLKTQHMVDWQKTGIHIVDLYASLCGVEFGDYKPEIYPIKVNLENYGLKENEDYICLHTESSLKYKDWPYFKELIDKLKTDFKIIVIDEQQQNYKHTIQLPHDIKLMEKAYVISKSKMLIGVDSMGIHMSSALGIPTIILYGNTLPELCKPLANDNIITLKPKKRCTEGWHHFCKEGEYCINTISVNDVLEKVWELLQQCKI